MIYVLIMVHFRFQRNHNAKLQEQMGAERKDFENRQKKELGALKEQLQVNIVLFRTAHLGLILGAMLPFWAMSFENTTQHD